MDLSNYVFPVSEKPMNVNFWNGSSLAAQPATARPSKKVIFREDTQEIISVVGQKYLLVPNADLIVQLLDELDNYGIDYLIDEKRSFVDNQRMRLIVLLPRYSFYDSDSEIVIRCYLENSYDGSQPVRISFGGIRKICSNGMIFANVITESSAKHTYRINSWRFREKIRLAINRLPALSNRITELEMEPVTKQVQVQVQRYLGSRMAKRIFDKQPQSKWEAYNEATYIISSEIEPHLRPQYQYAVSSVFDI